MRSGNPALKAETFANYEYDAHNGRMTINGTVNKSIMMLALLVITALFTWNLYNNGQDVFTWVIIAAIGGFVLALATTFSKKIAPVTAPIYAILEGVVLGGISAHYESAFNGITQQAVLLTFGVFAGLLLAYKSHLIKVTENFKLGVVAATAGIMLVYLVNIVLSFFGMSVPYLHEASPLGIGISIVIVIIAALNLVLDFDYIEEGAEMGAPKYMEWYSSMALMITLVWLYLEILRLLAKISSRD